jgi:hypothetical protein
MKKFAIVAMVAFGFAGSAMPAQADDEGWQMWGWGKGSGSSMMGQGRMGRMGIIDSNDDSVISADEAASQVETAFAAMDADDDGEITEEEFLNVGMGGGWEMNSDRWTEMQTRKKQRFVTIDPDKNGQVTQAEFIAGREKRYAEADGKKDGKVSPWEFSAMRWQ